MQDDPPTPREAPPAQRRINNSTDTVNSGNRLRQGHCAGTGGPPAVKGYGDVFKGQAARESTKLKGATAQWVPRSEDASRHADKLWGNVKRPFPTARGGRIGSSAALVEWRRPRRPSRRPTPSPCSRTRASPGLRRGPRDVPLADAGDVARCAEITRTPHLLDGVWIPRHRRGSLHSCVCSMAFLTEVPNSPFDFHTGRRTSSQPQGADKKRGRRL